MQRGPGQGQIAVSDRVLVLDVLDPAQRVLGVERGDRAQGARQRLAEDGRSRRARQHAERVVPETGGHELGRERLGPRGEPLASELVLEPFAQHAERGAEIAAADTEILQIGRDPVGLGAEPGLQRRRGRCLEQARLQHGLAALVGELAQRPLERGGDEPGVLDARFVGRAQPLAQRGGDGQRDGGLADHERQEAFARQLQDGAPALGPDRRRARLAGEQRHLAEEIARRERADP